VDGPWRIIAPQRKAQLVTGQRVVAAQHGVGKQHPALPAGQPGLAPLAVNLERDLATQLYAHPVVAGSPASVGLAGSPARIAVAGTRARIAVGLTRARIAVAAGLARIAAAATPASVEVAGTPARRSTIIGQDFSKTDPTWW